MAGLALPLLRAMRKRLHQRLQLQFQPGHDSLRRMPPDGSRMIPNAMAREIVVNKVRQCASRLLHRQGHGAKKCACYAKVVYGCRQRVRDRAPAAQFASRLSCSLTELANSSGSDRSIPHRLCGQQRDRVLSPTRLRRSAHNHDGVGGMHMYMPWWKGRPQKRFPSRLPH